MMASAFLTLFNTAQDRLDDEQLQALAALSNQAEVEATNLSHALSFLAASFAEKDDESLSSRAASKQLSNDDAAAILYQLAYVSANIAAMVHVADDAGFLAQKRAAAIGGADE
jgi:hypothetical protein